MVLIADLMAAGWIFRIYLRNRRKSALAFSIAWIFDFLAILSTTITNPIVQMIGIVLLPAFSAFIFYGAVKFLEEESITVRHRTLAILAIMPVAFMAYIVGVYLYTEDAVWTITSAATLGITGVFVIAGGLLLKETEEIYKSAVRYLYISVILFGLHLVPAALFGITEWYKAVGFTISTILIVSMVVAMVKLTSSESFTPQKGKVTAPVDLKPGVMIVNGKEYQAIKEKLKDRPVLAFVRDVTQVPDGWQYYFVTTIPFQGTFKDTIDPTNLTRMTELSYKYLDGLARVGDRGVVIIDCLEYLAVYNPWESLLKFLSKLRDFVVVNNGTLILVAEKTSFEPRQYAQLRKLME
ncbi:DUF835 domain-containing protein [Thermococcus sp. 21S7]|nr:DUF835 domain-containing protein [Thermococcus sp. 21S7]